MNLLSKLKHKYLSDLLLYSFLGCISYFILIKFSNVSIRLNEGVMQMQVFIAFLFLFNSLNVLIAEIEYNPANAVAFTRNLSDTYRYILISQDKKQVPLDEELRFLDTYMNLHRTRLGDCIHVEAELPDDIREDYIPPLTLQLLAENVIKHNVISMGRPMTITVSALCQDEQHWLVVSNPIRPKQGVTKTGKGLENLSVRYQLACQQKIEITQTPESFTVKVPLIS